MAPAAAPEPTYRRDEKVFCFHHELLYEAKVTDVKPNEGDDAKSGFQYKVHYKGWKNTYASTSLSLVCLLHMSVQANPTAGNHVCFLPTLRPRGQPLQHHATIAHQSRSTTALICLYPPKLFT